MQEALSRKEMQKIMAGSGSGSAGVCLTCSDDDSCARVNKGKCKQTSCNNISGKYCDMS